LTDLRHQALDLSQCLQRLAESEDVVKYMAESIERKEVTHLELAASVNAAVYVSESTKRKAEDLLFDEVSRKIRPTAGQQTTHAGAHAVRARQIGKTISATYDCKSHGV
jgi:hypothetical protein